MTVLYWLTAIASLVGVWLNVRRKVACFYVWAVTNALWVCADLQHEIYPQAALQLAYLGLALWGIWTWSRDDGPGGPAPRPHKEPRDRPGDPDGGVATSRVSAILPMGFESRFL